MNDIVDETLGNADPNDYARFILKSSDFDRPLNTSYQRRSQVSGTWLSVAVNMWTHILLKRCVLTNVAQYNHIPCFGYALVWAINRPVKDLTGVQYLAANENIIINEVSACFKASGVQYGPVKYSQYHLFPPCLTQNSRLIVVDAKDRTKNYYIKVMLSMQMILL